MSAGAFSPAARAAVMESTQGRCAGCGSKATEVHHRYPRGMGGTSRVSVGGPWNGIPACSGCHAWAESHRERARDLGWLLRDPVPSRPWWCYPYGWRRWIDVDGCWLVAWVDGPPPAATPNATRTHPGPRPAGST